MRERSIKEAETGKNTEIGKELSLPPVKIQCSVLAEDAIKAAIKAKSGVKMREWSSSRTLIGEESESIDINSGSLKRSKLE